MTAWFGVAAVRSPSSDMTEGVFTSLARKIRHQNIPAKRKLQHCKILRASFALIHTPSRAGMGRGNRKRWGIARIGPTLAGMRTDVKSLTLNNQKTGALEVFRILDCL